ncbi:MAG: TonB-dependent receptor, partial [Nanoarchaeota archaeon]
MFFTTIVDAQFSPHGFVSDASTKERLIGANVRIEGTTRGTTTNSYGFFSLPGIDSSEIKIRISFIGYETKIIVWQKNEIENKPLEIFLKPTNIQSQEVVIEADRNNNNVSSTSMGVTSIPILQIQTLPSVGGEVDLLKAVQLQSGVSSGNELSNGIYVRGGSFDQNLILLDGVTIYNPNHLFGFFSIFNTDAVKNIELIKGGVTAEYGGRLSSVLSFTLNEGNLEKTVWKGGVSLIASRISVEGPISDEKKGSYLLSVRRSYFDTFLWAIGGFKSGSPDFYINDITAKTNYSISENDRIFISGYFGRDNLNNDSKYNDTDIFSIDLAWGNQAYNVRWNHLWSPNFFSNIAVIYSDYTSEQKTYIFNTVTAKEPSVK